MFVKSRVPSTNCCNKQKPARPRGWPVFFVLERCDMASNMSRIRKIGDQIQRDLSKIIQQEVKDPRVGMVTVNDVKVSTDLSYAEVYFTCMAFGP
ncbi:30S ribosome-binding factor RbfA, partial [Reinekea sp.]|uniref:30S ribosome-binding factor RbfA n=1 Tax=Reinekea sp. TaxID=1970455 RepID=UPI002A7EB34D